MGSLCIIGECPDPRLLSPGTRMVGAHPSQLSRWARLLAVAVAIAVSACSPSAPPYTTAGCVGAAESLALAEQRWLDAVQAHAAADAALAENTADSDIEHDTAASKATSTRVDVIITEASVRHYCG